MRMGGGDLVVLGGGRIGGSECVSVCVWGGGGW